MNDFNLIYLSTDLKYINEIKDKEGKKDTRKTFFEMLDNCLRFYYSGIDNIIIKNIKNGGNLGIGVKSPEKSFNDLYDDNLRLNLLNNSWICFESTLRDICFVENNEKYRGYIWEIYKDKDDKIFNSEYNSKNKEGEENRGGKLFLDFFRHCRNAMHNNSIHDPKNNPKNPEKYKYQWKCNLNGKEYELKVGEKIKFISKEVVLEMVKKLSEVALDMWKNLNYLGFIPDRYNLT